MEIWYLFVENYAVCLIVTHHIILTVVLFLLKPAFVNYPGHLQNIFKAVAVHKYIYYFLTCVKLQVHNLSRLGNRNNLSLKILITNLKQVRDIGQRLNFVKHSFICKNPFNFSEFKFFHHNFSFLVI